MNAQAHDREYAAAAAYLHEQTPSPSTYAIGDYVSGTTCGKRWAGRISSVDGDRLVIDIDGGYLDVSAQDVTH